MRTRPGTMDEYVLKEIGREYGLLPVEGRTVLDLGGHIGGFGRWALDNGAAAVVAYEANAENAALYVENVPEAELHVEAVIGSDATTSVTLNVSTGSNTGSHSLYKQSATRYPVVVPAVGIARALDALRGDEIAVKIDVEGAEYEYEALFDLPARVRALAMELHLGRKQWRRLAPFIVDALAEQGFEALRSPRFTPSAWHVQGVWAR